MQLIETGQNYLYWVGFHPHKSFPLSCGQYPYRADFG